MRSDGKMRTFDRTEFTPKELFVRYREEVSYEAGLIATRTGWYVTTQAFMFSAVVLGIERGPGIKWSATSSILYPWIPLAGVFISILVFASVIGGVSSAMISRQALIAVVARHPELTIGSPKRKKWHLWVGLSPPLCFPVIFGGIWVILMADDPVLEIFIEWISLFLVG